MQKIINQILAARNSEYLLLSFILILGFLVRLYKIDNPVADWHSWRQADTASVTRIFVENGIDLVYPKYYDISTIQTGIFNPEGYRFVEFPIFNFFHAIFYKSLPVFTLEVWGRLVSIFSWFVSAFVLFLIGKKLMGKWGGILSSFFYSFIPFNIYFTRVILPEPMAVAFGLISILLFLNFVASEKYYYLLLSSLFFALALLVKPFTFFYFLPMAALALRKYGFKEILVNKKLIGAVFFAFMPLTLWRIWINVHPEGIPFWTWVFNDDGIRFKPSFWKWIFGDRIGQMILGGWGLVPFSFGILTKSKYLFNRLFLLGMFLYFVIVATANVRHDYYQTLAIPAISMALSSGSLFLWESESFNKWISRPFLVFCIFMMFLVGIYQIRDFYKVNHWEIVDAGKAVDRLTPKSSLVIAPYNGDTAFLYQTKRWGWPYVDRTIDELIDKGANYYVSVNFDDQTNDLIRKYEVVERTSSYVILDLGKSK